MSAMNPGCQCFDDVSRFSVSWSSARAFAETDETAGRVAVSKYPGVKYGDLRTPRPTNLSQLRHNFR
ncbi:predicted protein [Coccidioides posadasii str. Silveira]|uniref:Predicted protein n=1 Tax=Coccidioides posadasii (strain RMSCC 757 / Silveira) TaxID=443226 RepID=E9D0L1_COCPS|nr:predicted protein [Coccidioides posadasii str. Silveira]